MSQKQRTVRSGLLAREYTSGLQRQAETNEAAQMITDEQIQRLQKFADAENCSVSLVAPVKLKRKAQGHFLVSPNQIIFIKEF